MGSERSKIEYNYAEAVFSWRMNVSAAQSMHDLTCPYIALCPFSGILVLKHGQHQRGCVWGGGVPLAKGCIPMTKGCVPMTNGVS